MRSFKVGELKSLIKESSSEFKPVLGDGVESENKKNNDKSYKDSEKKVKKFDGGLKKNAGKKLPKRYDNNRTTLDYNPVVEPDDAYKKRVRAQVKGYTSELEEKNGIEKNADFDDKGEIYKNLTDRGNELSKYRKARAKAGLVSHNMPDEVFGKLDNHLSECVTLRFKKRVFEGELDARKTFDTVVESKWKNDGQTVRLKDKNGNSYVFETTVSEKTGLCESRIVSADTNSQKENVSRMMELFESDTATYGKRSNKARITEEDEFHKMMDFVRNK